MESPSASLPTAPPPQGSSSFVTRWKARISHQGAFIGTGMAIVFMYLSFCTVVVGPWLWLTTTFGMIKFIMLSTIFFLIVYDLIKAFTTDPGSIPPGWAPSGTSTEMLEEARGNSNDMYRRDFRIKVRYCDKCEAFKPPRCHHCRICQRCVLKMDHHCPWISACVGYQNQKYYLLFLIYAIIAAVIFLLIYCFWCYEALSGNNEADMEINGGLVFKIILATVNMVLLTVSLVLVFILLSRQLRLVAQNVSTIEVWEKRWAEQDCQERGQLYNHVYDLGLFRNLQQVFGSNVLLWPFPSEPSGDGINFPTNGRPEVSTMGSTLQLSDPSEEDTTFNNPYPESV